MKELQISNEGDLGGKLTQLRADALQGLRGGLEAVYITISRDSQQKRSNEQNKKFHALIRDIAKTAKTDKTYTSDVWKALLIDAFEQELKSQGEELPKPSRVAISLDGQRAVSIRPSSADFSKAISAKFIEFLYVFGVESGAEFSRESVTYFERATVEVHE